MPQVAFIADAPTTLAADARGSWVQIAKQGSFSDPRYGRFQITQADFDKWLANFTRLSIGDGRAGLPGDVDHGPEKRGETEAVGWITKLEQRGSGLWGFAEWTSLGRELISERRYLYISPSYVHDYEDEGGKKHGTALVGWALTNRPFLRMATVSLSAAPPAFATEEAPPGPTGDSRGQTTMPIPKHILQKLGLGEDATDEQAATAVDRLLARPEGQHKTLDELAKEGGKVVLDSSSYAELVSGAAAGAKAAKTLAEMTFESAFDKALSEGRITPAQKDGMRALYDIDGDKALKVLSELPKAINVEPQGHSGKDTPAEGEDRQLAARHQAEARGLGGADKRTLDSEMAKLDQRAHALMREKSVDYGEAVMLAAAELGLDD